MTPTEAKARLLEWSEPASPAAPKSPRRVSGPALVAAIGVGILGARLLRRSKGGLGGLVSMALVTKILPTVLPIVVDAVLKRRKSDGAG